MMDYQKTANQIDSIGDIQQGEKLDFSIEFNEETDQITIFDGENFEYFR